MHVVSEYTQRHQTKAFSLVGPPPRRVALAMALAVLSQPHLSVTFQPWDWVGSEGFGLTVGGVDEAPFLVDLDALGDALGLSSWELDQLRDDIDRNVSIQLKQRRALRWLWARYATKSGETEALLSILFPGMTDESSQLLGVGGQLYGLLNGVCRMGPGAMYTPYAIDKNEDRLNPRSTFVGRLVDPSLIEAMASGIGADEEEVVQILNTMIGCIPQHEAAAFVGQDLWRIRAFDSLTHLSRGYNATQWLFEPLNVAFLRPVDDWLEWEDEKISADLAQSCFDRTLIPRLATLVRQLHAQGLSNLLTENQHKPGPKNARWVALSDLDRLQLSDLFNSVAKPLLNWPTSPDGAQVLRQHLKLNEADLTIAQSQLQTLWRQRYKAIWGDGPRPDGHQTTLTHVLAHLCRTTLSLRQLWHRPPIDHAHQNILALFAGYYFSELPLDEAWKDAGEAQGADPVGQWFWPTWERVLNTLDDTSITTFSGFD